MSHCTNLQDIGLTPEQITALEIECHHWINKVDGNVYILDGYSVVMQTLHNVPDIDDSVHVALSWQKDVVSRFWLEVIAKL